MTLYTITLSVKIYLDIKTPLWYMFCTARELIIYVNTTRTLVWEYKT